MSFQIDGPGEYKTRGECKAVVLAEHDGRWYGCVYEVQSPAAASWLKSGQRFAGDESEYDLIARYAAPPPPEITAEKLREVASWYPGSPDCKAAMLMAANTIERTTAERDALAAKLEAVTKAAEAVLASEYCGGNGLYLLYKNRYDTLAQATKGSP